MTQAKVMGFKMKAGDNVKTKNAFGAPYLGRDVVYRVRSVLRNGCIVLGGRMGTWPPMYFEVTDEPTGLERLQAAHPELFDGLVPSSD